MKLFGPSFPCHRCGDPSDAPLPSIKPICRTCQVEDAELVLAALRVIERKALALAAAKEKAA